MAFTKNPKVTPATIRAVLRERGPLSNRQVAEALGVHPTTTLYWMQGLAKAADIETDRVVLGNGKPSVVYSIKEGR